MHGNRASKGIRMGSFALSGYFICSWSGYFGETPLKMWSVNDGLPALLLGPVGALAWRCRGGFAHPCYLVRVYSQIFLWCSPCPRSHSEVVCRVW